MSDIPARFVTKRALKSTAVAYVLSLYSLLAVPAPTSAAGNCGVLKGGGAVVTRYNIKTFKTGAFPLLDGQQVALFGVTGKRTFGAIELVRYQSGYEAFWRPARGARFLLLLNGTDKASLVPMPRIHWMIPGAPGMIVGPLLVTSCTR